MKNKVLFIIGLLLLLPLSVMAMEETGTKPDLLSQLSWVNFLTPVISYLAIALSGLAKKLPKNVTLFLVPIIGVISMLIAQAAGGDVNWVVSILLSLGAVFIDQFQKGLTETEETKIDKAKTTLLKLEPTSLR